MSPNCGQIKSKLMYKNKDPHVAPFVVSTPNFIASYEVFAATVFDLLKSVGVNVALRKDEIFEALNNFTEWLKQAKRDDELDATETALENVLNNPDIKAEDVPDEFMKLMQLIMVTRPEDM